ncbi:DNA-7-methylguanine glycosylase [Flavobacterium succinicans]|uniref:DNA-7-methylguanine glycosylase n=1 Tax=Flavobacterium succinicans TaxID=29536 RepID=A0A1I4WPP1_9FLAO|nr:DNA alkylation repair protein [Flavobacterium succinicans]SFN15126.1 DNA-7-methylguanine glycosylase [Flavobacterium succinicans]
MDFITALEKEFIAQANTAQSSAMEAYMKNHFPFFGIAMPQRRVILKSVSAEYSDSIKANTRTLAFQLYEKPQREFHYCAIELLIQNCSKKLQKDDIHWIERRLLTYSWWDTVDTISKYLLGRYLTQFPEQTNMVIEKFSNASNIWLNRSTLLFQLDYKKNTNFSILESVCEHFKESNEFFIQKAIGWALREYSKINPIAVQNYVTSTNLKPLSKKEALRIIEKQ